MGDRNRRGEPGKRGTERTGRIALYHQEVRGSREQGHERRGHGANVAVRILLAAAMEAFGGKCTESEILGIESRMLAGQDQRRRQSPRGKRVGDRCQFDRFGPGADHQPYVGIQPSP
jgi:hypothetical protein